MGHGVVQTELWVAPPAFYWPGASPVTDLFHWEGGGHRRPRWQPYKGSPKIIFKTENRAHREGRTQMGAAPSSPTKAEPNRRRIRKELHNLWVDPPPFCRPGPSPVADLLHWEVIIDGPEDSPYAGGTFTVDIQFPCRHPLQPAKITFKTKVYHPNVDSEGQMVLDIFDKNWSPAMTINHLLLCIVSVLYDPLLDYPINRDMARLYQRNIKLYEEKARAWTRKYASAPVVSYYPEKGDEQWQEYCDAFAAHYAEMAKERKRRREEKRLQAAASSTGQTLPTARGVNLVWRRAVAFLQGRSIAVPSSAKAVAN